MDVPVVRESLLSGVVLFAIVALWQIGSAATGLTAWFVPVACLLQLLVLGPTLWMTAKRGFRYGRQVAVGTAASVVAGVGIALSSLVVTAMFPEALAAAGGSAIGQAIGGFVGTVGTGLVLSLLLGLVFRARERT